jgi:cobalt-zinc-cadmium efflux system membrane fusion protein
MNAEIELKMSNVASINDDAIVSFEGRDFVFISKGNNRFDMLEIKRGSSENNFTEINTIDGKDISDLQFVIKGAYSLLMQLKNKSEE